MKSLRWPAAVVLLAGALVLPPAGAQAAVTEDNFVARTTGDIVALCTTEPTDALYTAAVNFCQGFGVGTYSVLATAQRGNAKYNKLFCEPEKGLTRNEAVAAFVSWARAKPQRLTLPAVDGVALYLLETYPCPKPAGHPAARRTP
jgi:hypothetical protein